MSSISLELLQEAILQLIMKQSGLTQREIDNAKDREVKKGCLILTKKEYEEKAFKNRKDFKFVIAKNLKTVSYDLFYGCSLQFTFMPEVESIAVGAFTDCPLTAVCFLKVKTVGGEAFHSCSQLSKVFLPICEELDGRCFIGCRNIKILNLPKVKIVGGWQFVNCSSLTDLIIPLVGEVGEMYFWNCHSLESIDSKLDANQFRCNDECKQKKNCLNCRGQLEECLKKGNDPQNRLKVQKKVEEQKLALLQEAGVEPVSKVEDTKSNVQIQKKTKDEQIEELVVQMQEKDEQLKEKDEQIKEILKDVDKRFNQHDQKHQLEKEQHQQEIEKLEQKFNIKVERMVRKFENQEKENIELKKAVENFVRLLADK